MKDSFPGGTRAIVTTTRCSPTVSPSRRRYTSDCGFSGCDSGDSSLPAICAAVSRCASGGFLLIGSLPLCRVLSAYGTQNGHAVDLSTGDLARLRASFDELRMRESLCATKILPHPELAEGRTTVTQPAGS